MKQMSMAMSVRRCTLALAATLAVNLAMPAWAQEPTAEHLASARAAIDAIGATDRFDNILPAAAQQLKTTLIQTAPNLQEIISVTVDETAIEMAGRRGDLEREAATIYAKNFTADELDAIQTFYNSDAGKKLLQTGPVVTRQLLQAAEIWANGVNRDLSVETDKLLRARIGTTPAESQQVEPEAKPAE